MKDFADYLKESASIDICWWFQQPTEIPLKELIYFFMARTKEQEDFLWNGRMSPNLENSWNGYCKYIKMDVPFPNKDVILTVRAIGDHFEKGAETLTTIASKNLIYARLKPLLKCANRSAWAYYTGKGYRGTTLGLDDIDSVKFHTVSFRSNDYTLTGDITYKSRYEGQAWATSYVTAKTFAQTTVPIVSRRTDRARLGAVMETQLTKDETLFNSGSSAQILRAVLGDVSEEDEALRLSNAPKKCLVHINLKEFVEKMEWKRGGYHNDPEWANTPQRWTVNLKPVFTRHLGKYFASQSVADNAFQIVVQKHSNR